MVQIMITNGGPHSHEKWAIATAQQIIEIGANATSTQAMDARKLENKIIDLLEVHHQEVQENERAMIKDRGHDRLSEDLAFDVSDRVDGPVSQIVSASVGTPFEAHFAKPEVQAYLRDLIATHFRTSMQIERSWHADRHPDTEHAKAFRERHRFTPPPPVALSEEEIAAMTAAAEEAK